MAYFCGFSGLWSKTHFYCLLESFSRKYYYSIYFHKIKEFMKKSGQLTKSVFSSNLERNCKIMSETMFRHFCSNHPCEPEEVESYYKCDPFALHVRLKNGDCYYYDELDQTSRYLPPDSRHMSDRHIRREFANRLRRIMWRKDVTQLELSEGTGITQGMISKYLNQAAVPTFISAVRIAKYLECSLDDLTYND